MNEIINMTALDRYYIYKYSQLGIQVNICSDMTKPNFGTLHECRWNPLPFNRQTSHSSTPWSFQYGQSLPRHAGTANPSVSRRVSKQEPLLYQQNKKKTSILIGRNHVFYRKTELFFKHNHETNKTKLRSVRTTISAGTQANSRKMKHVDRWSVFSDLHSRKPLNIDNFRMITALSNKRQRAT
jgi:hypothetical protein